MNLLNNLISPLECRRFLVDTYTHHREFTEPLVLQMLGGFTVSQAFDIHWEHCDQHVLSVEDWGHSVFLHRNTAAWLQFCRGTQDTGSICRSTQSEWLAYVDSLTAGKYSAQAIENCYHYYDEIYRKGSYREGPEGINDVIDAILFDSLDPETTLTDVFDEIVRSVYSSPVAIRAAAASHEGVAPMPA